MKKLFLIFVLFTKLSAFDRDPERFQELVFPYSLNKGDTIGIFTPSWPAHIVLRDKYIHALDQIQKLGFNYIEGKVTKSFITQGYRTASPKERAEEFMDLIRNPEVKCLMATIGGWNSSSLIPYLDFDEIRRSRKIICGYSDITALHLAIFKFSRLSTFYGPSLVPSFGEYPQILPYTLGSFLKMVSCPNLNNVLKIEPPTYWSNQFIDATNENWKEKERIFFKNEGWKILSTGKATGQIIVANLDVLLSLAGTPYFPFLEGKILLVEETFACFEQSERRFRQLDLMGVYDKIIGLIISKPEFFDNCGAAFSYEDLIQEITGLREYPIITNFDCGHSVPLITLPEGIVIYLNAENANKVEFYIMGF